MPGALAAILVPLAVGLLEAILGHFTARADHRALVLAKAREIGSQRVTEALLWLTRTAGDPDGGLGPLRVRPDGVTIRLPGPDPIPACPSPTCPLRGAA